MTEDRKPEMSKAAEVGEQILSKKISQLNGE
jgi:hypothetical protein